MYTFQDFKAKAMVEGIPAAVQTAIQKHRSSPDFKEALEAEAYDHQKNTTILNYVKTLYTMSGARIADPTAANSRLCSNFFHRLNTQRMTYSMGNGVTFEQDGLKEKLGQDFDTRMRSAVYNALIHGQSFLFWNVDHLHVFPFTEFAPLWDEETGELKAGVRWWQIDSTKPVMAVLYEEDGFTRFKGNRNCTSFEVTEQKRAYKVQQIKAPADTEPEIIGEENYGTLPIVPIFGSRLKQSTLVGIRSKIDAYDLISSGLANDFEDCACIYWIVSGAGGMNNNDLAEFRDRLKLNHIAAITDTDAANVTPYTQDIPTTSRTACLQELRAGIYEDFGGLDVHTIAAGATNDHIDAAYQPMDENADDLEYQVIEAVQRLLLLQGVTEGTPIFKRNRISNEKEKTEMILESAQYLDEQTILTKLPFLTPDEIEGIMQRKEEEENARYLTQAQRIDAEIQAQAGGNENNGQQVQPGNNGGNGAE